MRTPSQTAGPYFTIGLCRRPENEISGGDLRVRGHVLDGDGRAVNDACLEVWHPDVGYARCGTDAEGRYSFLLPSGVRHVEVMVFARGLLKPVVTRLYLAADVEAEDPTMLADWEDGEARFDVCLRGDGETAFFEV